MQTRQLIAPDGTLLTYWRLGHGPTVLLLHGFTMWSQMWWENGVVSALGPRARLLVPDLRGHGASGRPVGAESYGQAMLDDLMALLDAEYVDEAHIVGFSLGAELGLTLATRWPGRVASVLLIGSGWTPASGQAAYVDVAREIRDRGEAITPDPDFDAFEALAAATGAHVGLPKSAIAAVRRPVGGIVGADDPERPNLERLVGVLPGFSLDVLPGADHMTSWNDPSIPARVSRFLDGVRVAR